MGTPPLSTATAWGGQVSSFKNGAQPTSSAGSDSRDRAAMNDWTTAHSSPSYWAQSAAIPGYSHYSAYKALTGYKKKRSAWNAYKNEMGRRELSKMGGEEAFAYGYKPEGNVKANSAVWAAAQQQAKTKRNEARVNMAYGYLPSMRNTNPYSIALNNNALIHGEVEHTTDLVRDASAADNTASAEANARAAAMRASASGTVGSSMDRSNKQRVLGSFLAGRGATASNAMGARVGATQGLERERLGALAAVKGRGSIDLGQRVADLSTIRQLGEAQGQVIPGAIGGAISGLGDMYANNQLYATYARGAGSSGSMPSLSGGSSRTTGGFRSR
jgi:hypothetical protein